MRIRLADEDRERLGLEQEWIEGFSATRFMMADAEALEVGGYDPDEFLEDLAGRPVVRGGEPVMEPELDGDGSQVLVDGKPKMIQARRVSARTRRAIVWLAVRRAGSTVPFSEFDVQVNGIRYEKDDEDQVGKEPAAAPVSPKRASATRSRSSRSSASNPGKSRS